MSLSSARRHVFVGATLFISVAGTLFGASLKSNQQKQETSKRVAEITPEQQIAMLAETRGRLVSQKEEVQRKINGVRERMEKKTQLEKDREMASKIQR